MSRHPKKKKHATVRKSKSPVSSSFTQEEDSIVSVEDVEPVFLPEPAADLTFESDSAPFTEYETDTETDSEYTISDLINSTDLSTLTDEPGDSLSYDFEDYAAREPDLKVPSTPQFLSFVDAPEDTSRTPAPPIPEMCIADIIAELSSSLVLSSEVTPTSEDTSPEVHSSDYISMHDTSEAFDDPFPPSDSSVYAAEEAPVSSSFDSDDIDFDFNRDFDSLRAELNDIPAEPLEQHSLDDLFAGLDNLGSEEAISIDSRFHIGGASSSAIRFGGKEVDLSADPDYVHAEQPDYFSVPAEDDSHSEPLHTQNSSSSRPSFLSGFLGRRNSAKDAEIRASLSGRSVPSLSAEPFSEADEPVSELSYSSDFELDPIALEDTMVPDSVASYYTADDRTSSLTDEQIDFSDIDAIIASVKVPGSFQFAEESATAADHTEEEEEKEAEKAPYEPIIPSSAATHTITGSHAVDYFEDAPAEGYYNDTDYDFTDPDGDDFESATESVDYFPSTFKEYIASGFTAFLFKLRPAERGGSATMEDKSEFLGPELSPAAASRYYGSFSASLRGRFRLSVILLLIMMYVSIGWPTTGMLRSVTGAAEFCLLFQLAIMVLCLDIVTTGIMDLVRRKPGATTLSVIACLFTSLDVLISAILHKGSLHMPLCVFSSLSLVGLQFASMLHARGMRKALRVPAISKRCYSVTGEMNVKPREITLLKSVRPATGFVRRAEEASPDEEFFQKAAPFLFLLSILLGVIATVAARSPADLFYYIGATLSASVPFTALLAFSLPFYLGSVSIFKSGAAIAGWSGLSDIGRSKNLIITDRDLFPDGAVDFDSIRIFADEDAEKVITYAGTMVTASGSCLTAPFADLMLRNKCRMRNVSNFEFLAGGGFKGLIDGDVVICGNSDVLRLLNIRVPFTLTDRSTVLLAINGVLYGIFKMKYTPNSHVREALLALIRSGRHPIFAIRDFNVTPDMLHEIFDIATDGYDFPPYVDRNRISSAEPSEDSKISAVVCREGLGPLTHLADTGHSMYRAVQLNAIITGVAAVIGLLSMFVLLLTRGFVPISAFVLFVIIAALPVFFISVFMKD